MGERYGSLLVVHFVGIQSESNWMSHFKPIGQLAFQRCKRS